MQLSIFESENEQQLIDQAISELLARCNAEGIDPKAVLMQLQLRHLWDSYLSKLPQQKQWEFAARLIDLIQD